MINGKKVVVVLPAYNAERTLQQTVAEIPQPDVDEIVLVDDASTDQTTALAEQLNIRHIVTHQKNRGYGGNQKTCYRTALDLDADIVVMLHPDYQYTPKLITAMAGIIANGVYPVVLGSRILGNGARRGGMPLYKYIANRFLTLFQNICSGQKLSEYHTGYRAFSADVLRHVDFEANSDDFVFDNEMLAQIIYAGNEIAEVTCPTHYFAEASSINLRRSITYGMGVVRISLLHLAARLKLARPALFKRYKQIL